MLETATGFDGMVTAPHRLAAEAGLGVLQDGGNAIEAMVAAAAAIAVVYPHMNGIGGDGFWLIHAPGAAPVAIDACGPAGGRAEAALYLDAGHDIVPVRGALAANTVAGAVAGWQEALALSAEWGGAMALERLLEPAIHFAGSGAEVTASQFELAVDDGAGLYEAPGFAQTYLVDGAPPPPGSVFRQPRLAATLKRLSTAGLDDFYRGDLARSMAADLDALGSPVGADDLARYRAARVMPLSVRLGASTVYNLPPPTQGFASLMILGLFERLGVTEGEGFAHVHGIVEATKQAFRLRDGIVTDPAYMTADPAAWLGDAALERTARRIDRRKAQPWPALIEAGDTVWLGAVDGDGRTVSYIQSIYWEYGSGMVLPGTGVLWQNRGSGFGVSPGAAHPIRPGRKPFHTLNPALAQFHDGRVMAYGAMGGEGQPQTQAAIYTRYATFGMGLQEAVTAPRWLLGRTWGMETAALKIESRLDPALIAGLSDAGHRVETVGPFSQLMGHAGALVRHPSGLIEGASDPRSDGRAAGF